MRAAAIFLAAVGFALPAPPCHALVPQVRISGINDFSLGTWNIAQGSIDAHIDVCVYADDTIPAGSYVLVITSSTGGYTVKSGANQIAYDLEWDSGGAGNLGGSSVQLLNGIGVGGFLNANASSTSCASGPTARLKLSIT